MTDFGYIVIARGIMDHPQVGAKKPYSEYEAWNWLLFEAAFRPRQIRIQAGRSPMVITVERGQLSHSLRFMASKWGWLPARVRRFLKRLENGTLINTQKDTEQTLITICNYNKYQIMPVQRETQSETQTDTDTKQKRNKEERTKSIKDSYALEKRASEPEGFAEWYQTYPRRKQRDDAVRAYRKAIPSQISAADLLSRTKTFAAEWAARPKDDLQFCPYPASWLNRGEYKDAAEPIAGPAPTAVMKPTRDPRTFTVTEWQQRVTRWRGGMAWPEMYWGPQPGSPGCLVPSDLLRERPRAAHAQNVEALAGAAVRDEPRERFGPAEAA